MKSNNARIEKRSRQVGRAIEWRTGMSAPLFQETHVLLAYYDHPVFVPIPSPIFQLSIIHSFLSSLFTISDFPETDQRHGVRINPGLRPQTGAVTYPVCHELHSGCHLALHRQPDDADHPFSAASHGPACPQGGGKTPRQNR